VVVGDYPNLDPLDSVVGPKGFLEAATVSLASAFSGEIIDYNESTQE
jgi:hypothetical protein